jgi:hypothetical protein
MVVEYYSQRATKGGLMISEGIPPSLEVSISNSIWRADCSELNNPGTPGMPLLCRNVKKKFKKKEKFKVYQRRLDDLRRHPTIARGKHLELNLEAQGSL